MSNVIAPNYNNWNHNVDAIIEALQVSGFQARFEREGSSNKKHLLLGVGLYFVDSNEQYVIPCYNDLAFEMNPVVLREGKLIVCSKSVGRAASTGHQWFESWVVEGNGRFTFFMTSQDKVNEAIRTIPPIYEPLVPLVDKEVAASVAAEAATDAVNAVPPAGAAAA